MRQEEILQTIIAKVLAKLSGFSSAAVHPRPIPVGVSNRHVHLSQADLETLFGAGYQLKPERELSQPGQYAAHESVLVGGPKGCIERVRVLGPVRKQTQVEVSSSDAYRLGITPPLRESGKLTGSAAITVIGPQGSIRLQEGSIISQRHIHMNPADSKEYGVPDGAKVQVKFDGERGLIFDQVVVRVHEQFMLELHLDTDEGNAAGIRQGDVVYLINYNSLSVTDGQESRPGSKKIPLAADEPLSLVTEAEVRLAWKNKRNLIVKETGLITPLARDTIKELGVPVVIQ